MPLPPRAAAVIASEGAERFSFYGMTSILTIHLVRTLGMAGPRAEATFHVFYAACYVTPLLGGWLADRWLGRYRTILALSLGYVLGHALIALDDRGAGLYAGMALIALGAGGIKPCVSVFLGDQLPASALDRAYAMFYFAINLGSVAAQLAIPQVLRHAGPAWAFGLPGVLMAIALVVFVAPSRGYVKVPAARGGGGDARALRPIVALFAPVIVFWSLISQYGSTWVLQAERMDRRFIFVWESSQLGFLNAFLVIVLVPLFTYVVYPALARRGVDVSPLARMRAGMFVAVLSFVAAAAIEVALLGGARPNVMWQFFQYLAISVADVLITIGALEVAYVMAPEAMKSTVMSLWFLTIAAGNLLAALVSAVGPAAPLGRFVFFAGLMLVAAVVFSRRRVPAG